MSMVLLGVFLTDVETLVAARSDRRAVDAGDLREGRSLAQALFQVAEQLVGALRHHFHGAVGTVPGEAAHPEARGLSHHEVAIAHSLHAALHDEAICGHSVTLRAWSLPHPSRPPSPRPPGRPPARGRPRPPTPSTRPTES